MVAGNKFLQQLVYSGRVITAVASWKQVREKWSTSKKLLLVCHCFSAFTSQFSLSNRLTDHAISAVIIRRVVAARQLHAQQQQQQQQRPQQLKKSPSKLGLFPQRQSPTRPQASSSSPHLLSKEAGSAFDFADGPGDKRRMGFWGRLKCW
ncbi:uncharacterized protein KY384_005846 [Bacidia gigantensis]|uniref:uncharacterized protein n=1 Tax=Bacidia gigantensis TaxID=2732470 RepID=UPI001D04B046|nr:uncharacterized protein KY384_005846 [Bacidia gigantensis]KAG8529211.1 hypothetical protein KY384_005846 [Bacidia gigantensis]